uniref:Uncharacterized protein n=1 Tax=Rhizophora mucronata TaxID=61149 RepID=A0A2P2N919_RHIMU
MHMDIDTRVTGDN